MKTLTNIHLTAAIFAVVLINITTQLDLPILNVFRPISEAFEKREEVQKIRTAIDIYMKDKKIKEQSPEAEKNLIEQLYKICRKDSTLFDFLGVVNKCTFPELHKQLKKIEEKYSLPVFG